LVWKGMQEPIIGVGMGLTAENLAEKYQISRQEQDAFAVLSHQRAAKAIAEGKFFNEITPISIPVRRGEPVVFDTDEHPRPDTSLEGLAKLPAIFKKEGTVTAGNACGMNDAAAAVVVVEWEKAKELGLKPLAKIKEYHVAGVDPDYMGIGPVPAIQGALEKAKHNLSEIDRFEINEAFAAQYLACEKELGLDRDKVNVYGNGIALGHPVGATGCRLVVTLLYGMLAEQLNLGIASLCAGGGMGFALLLERL
jgi:acetyl-CoA C-acetyltransferase